MLEATVHANFTPLLEYKRQINLGIHGRGSGRNPITDALEQWGGLYRGFAQERFTTYAKGGGDWKELEQSTIDGRREGDIVGSDAILWDTGTLLAALDINLDQSKGAIQDFIDGGIRVGYGGKVRHPNGESASIADIAYFHDQGEGVPQREIIVDPPYDVVSQMVELMKEAIARTWQKAVA